MNRGGQMFPSYRIEVDTRRGRQSGSPLVPLLDLLAARLVAVSNEGAGACVHLTITDDDAPVCVAESRTNARCSMRVFEFLWCLTHGAIRFYQDVVAGQPANGQEVELDSYPDAADALRTGLTWALECLVRGGSGSRWPPVLSPPDLASAVPEDALIREVAMAAVMTLLLHEVSHVEHWGELLPVLVDEERADADAVRVVMGSPALESIPSGTRGMGVAIAMLFDLAPALWTGDYDGIEHPASYHRLVSSIPSVGAEALALLSATIPLLMENRWPGYRPPDYEFASHLEAVLFFACLLAEADRKKLHQ